MHLVTTQLRALSENLDGNTFYASIMRRVNQGDIPRSIRGLTARFQAKDTFLETIHAHCSIEAQ